MIESSVPLLLELDSGAEISAYYGNSVPLSRTDLEGGGIVRNPVAGTCEVCGWHGDVSVHTLRA